MISIIIVTKNRSLKFTRSILSILFQRKFESVKDIIVIDNGSSKLSLIYKRLLEFFIHKLRLYSHSELNLGQCRNIGILNSKGEYFTFLDDDDYLSKNFILSSSIIIKSFHKKTGLDIDVVAYHGESDLPFEQPLYTDFDFVTSKSIQDKYPSFDNYHIDKFTKIYLDNGCKVFRKELYNLIDHKFEKSRYEDTLPIGQMILKSNYIIRVPQLLYIVGRSNNSITSKITSDDLIEITDNYIQYFQKD
jgi:glycosyltransferase involved in cell wall biosynthesis